MPTPILSHHGWDALVAELAGNMQCRFLAEVPPKIAAAVLAAPAAIALWIATRLPALREREPLRVLVIGAETVDAVDEGRWYGLVPHLLGRPGTVEVTLLGEQLEAGFHSDVAHLAPERPARRSQATLSVYLRRGDAAAPDIAFMFHPGMQKNRLWLDDGSLARIVSTGIPLVASAYEEVECEMDQWVARCYGFAAAGDPLLNPYYLDLSDERTRIQWARALWQFGSRLPSAGEVPDREGLDALDRLTSMVMHSMLAGGAPAFQPGARIELQSSAGARRSLIHVFDGYCADPATRELLQLTPAGELRGCGSLNQEEMSSYPATAARDLERALWAARIKSERILSPGALDRLGERAAARASSMFSALRGRARSQFRR